ncbi:hypothetical protein [Verrucomicrobium sp. 3C]|uniref:hypothetical protein n=1 Tax=Verrucomicrobium sp. 3C TaxID=1134055 RepID=UPI0003622281|nr:hypothetical protein [Verrucomicrobium sp. 3C]
MKRQEEETPKAAQQEEAVKRRAAKIAYQYGEESEEARKRAIALFRELSPLWQTRFEADMSPETLAAWKALREAASEGRKQKIENARLERRRRFDKALAPLLAAGYGKAVAAAGSGLRMAEMDGLLSPEERVQCLEIRKNALFAEKVRTILGCTRTELDRWDADGRLLHRFTTAIDVNGKRVHARRWLLPEVEAAHARIGQWRNLDEAAKKKRRKLARSKGWLERDWEKGVQLLSRRIDALIRRHGTHGIVTFELDRPIAVVIRPPAWDEGDSVKKYVLRHIGEFMAKPGAEAKIVVRIFTAAKCRVNVPGNGVVEVPAKKVYGFGLVNFKGMVAFGPVDKEDVFVHCSTDARNGLLLAPEPDVEYCGNVRFADPLWNV